MDSFEDRHLFKNKLQNLFGTDLIIGRKNFGEFHVEQESEQSRRWHFPAAFCEDRDFRGFSLLQVMLLENLTSTME